MSCFTSGHFKQRGSSLHLYDCKADSKNEVCEKKSYSLCGAEFGKVKTEIIPHRWATAWQSNYTAGVF